MPWTLRGPRTLQFSCTCCLIHPVCCLAMLQDMHAEAAAAPAIATTDIANTDTATATRAGGYTAGAVAVVAVTPVGKVNHDHSSPDTGTGSA